MVARSLFDLFDASVARFPDRDALIHGDSHLTFAQLATVVGNLAAGLAIQGLRRGDRVALMMPNLPQFPIAYYALLALGAIVVPVNVMFREAEIEQLLADAQVSGFIAWEGFSRHLLPAARKADSCRVRVLLRQAPAEAASDPSCIDFSALLAGETAPLSPTDVQADEPALILYTSGTTGAPRGAVLTHANLAAAVLSCWEAFAIHSEHRFAAALPLYHGLGQMLTLNVPLAAGAATVLLPRIHAPEVIAAIANERITHFVAVPALLRLLLDSLDSSTAVPIEALQSLQAFLVSGAPLDEELRAALELRFGKPVYEGYGLAECPPLITSNRPDIEVRAGSVGRQMPGLEVTIFDPQGVEASPGEIGQIVVRGAAVMTGYHNRPEDTSSALRDGWLFTGDMGHMDSNGYLFLADRHRDMILKGGFHVFPQEVESCLLSHPKVSECAVIGVPDRVLGEEVKAYVVLRPHQSGNKDELLEYCMSRLAAYKCPRHFEFCQDLPHGPTGKILKRMLRERSSN